MSLFYKSEPMTPTVFSALHDALITDPAKLGKPPQEVAAEKTKEVTTKVTGPLAVGRVVAAFVLLALIGAAGIWCENYDNLKRWTDVLYDAFKVGLPGLIGLIIGESTAKR